MQLLTKIKTIWLNPKYFFKEIYPRETVNDSVVFAIIMIILSLSLQLVEMKWGAHYHWLQFVEQIILLSGAWFFFAVVVSICTNIFQGSGGFQESFRLGAYLMVANFMCLLILPFYTVIVVFFPPGKKIMNFLFVSWSFLAAGMLIIILSYLIIRLSYVIYVGIREVHKLTSQKAIITIIATVITVIALLVILVKLPFYAIMYA